MGSDSDIVEKFLKFGADINAQNDCFSSNNAGYTPLHFAVQFGRQSIVEVLLKYGADINIENCNGYTPLHLAVSKRLKFVNIFLREREVDLSVKNSFNQTFADVLLKNMEEFNEDFVECSMNILRCGAAKNANFSTKTLLINLLLNNFGTPTLKKLIEFIPNLSETDSQRRTIMHHCLKQYYNLFQNYRGRLADKIEILLENGIPLDQQDRCGRTPLHYAGLCYKNLEHVVTFLNLGADINVIDSEGHTPYTCCFKNVYDTHTPIVEKYHEHIAKIEAAGLYLHPLNRERKRRNSYLYGEYSYVLDEKAMDRVIYDSLRLRDLLTEEIVLNFTMMTPSKREFIKKFLRSKSLHEEFAEWSALFNLQYRKMLERQSLWGSAVESLYESLDRISNAIHSKFPEQLHYKVSWVKRYTKFCKSEF
ncbi:serine/threonine-protein phosphatase 6 regulatory ankyrin repeat subunit B-like [Copidosoma floridanum]|uniref:serine/threonine-protein phosphatase 6 regulatory ankyrin repeat subunit B-like n=1 Tax=Copidosoma floridanum TaxID=29053 RepID=UPI0006C9BF4A|nr:serine/threonine-protein phosphatase 6 regulatory ankyrin repeat subunit B-like [Copidosoma floridanum]